MPNPKPKRVDLALQGGGAHGAFTWGVLDRLLEEESIEIEAVSGASAGAMNACAVVDGLAQGGREGAREKLKNYWMAVSETSRFSPLQRSFMDKLLGRWSLDYSPGFIWSRCARSSPSHLILMRSTLANQLSYFWARQMSELEIRRFFGSRK